MKNKNIFLLAAIAVLALNIVLVPNANAAVKLEVPKSIVDLWQKIKLQKAQADETGGTLSVPPTPPTAPSGENNTQNLPSLNNPGQQPPNDNFQPKFYPDPDHIKNDRSYPDPDHQNFIPNPTDDQKNLGAFKKGANQMNGMLNNFQKQMQGVQKGKFPSQMQDQMQQAKGLINKIKDAKSTSDLGDNTVDQLQDVMGELQDNGQKMMMDTQRLNGMKKEIGNLEKNITNFQKQIDKLSKQGISAPGDVTENLNQIKTIIDAVKNAQTMNDAQNAGMENMGDLMSNLNDSRQQLEMLSRWTQTSKQLDKELKNFDRMLGKDKSLVDKLSKQGVDLGDTFQKLSDGLTQLKSTRDQAAEKIKSGDAEGAYDLLESDFFDKTDDLREQQSVFDTLSNLGRFNTNFKRETASAKKMIASLGKQGQDVTDLNNQLTEIIQKGNELSDALKAKPIDIEAISSQLEDLSSLRQDFQNALQELSPDNSPKPWEQGQNQFQNLKLSPNFNNLLAPTTANQQ